MLVYGKWVDATITAGSNVTSAIDLERDYDYVSVIIPAMAECKLWLKVAERTGSDYYDLGKDTTTNEESFNRADVWRLGGYQFIKVASSVNQPNAVTIRIRGMRY